MLFDVTFPCYLTTFSGKKCLSGKVICAFYCPAYRNFPVQILAETVDVAIPINSRRIAATTDLWTLLKFYVGHRRPKRWGVSRQAKD
jgi:hypothetical protein